MVIVFVHYEEKYTSVCLAVAVAFHFISLCASVMPIAVCWLIRICLLFLTICEMVSVNTDLCVKPMMYHNRTCIAGLHNALITGDYFSYW